MTQSPGEQTPAAAGPLAGFLLLLMVSLYVFAALHVDASRPLWMDEVLAVWISRLASPSAIWNAIAHGAEFSPPTYHLLLHGLSGIFGGSTLVLRLPSLMAALGCAVAVLALLRRRVAFPFAALAAALTLELALYSFAVQARPYVLVTACFALALVGWDRAGSGRVAAWRPILIAVALCLAVALHFYAILLIGLLILMEAVRSLALRSSAVRRIRTPIWLALAVPLLSLAAWLPLIRAIRHYNTGDTGAPQYYARPVLASLLSSYGDLLLGPNATLLIGFVLIMALALLLQHFVPPRTAAAASVVTGLPSAPDRDLDLDIMTAATTALPLLVFAAALFTGTFNERYALATSLGVAILYARLVARMPGGAWVACGLLAVSCGLWANNAAHSRSRPVNPDLVLLQRATGDLPIVIGDGLRFLELAESAGPQLRRRLVFLSTPGIASPDPTNQHQVERWRPLRPDLDIADFDSFLASHKTFYLFASANLKDVVTARLIDAGAIGKVDGNALETDTESWLVTVQLP